jgi:hypothetical protein
MTICKNSFTGAGSRNWDRVGEMMILADAITDSQIPDEMSSELIPRA